MLLYIIKAIIDKMRELSKLMSNKVLLYPQSPKHEKSLHPSFPFIYRRSRMNE